MDQWRTQADTDSANAGWPRQCTTDLAGDAGELWEAFQGIEASAAIIRCGRRKLARDVAATIVGHAAEDTAGRRRAEARHRDQI
jgi:hypothetical protein